MIQPRRRGRDHAGQPGRWLLLVHQLPSRPVSARVKTWRRLRQLGAVAVKNSVYALPDRPETREDFEWVCAEIVAAGGQATVFQASAIDEVSESELRDAFRRERQQDYRALIQAVATLSRQLGRRRSRDPRAIEKAVRAWHGRLAQIEALDYFSAPGRDEARDAIRRLGALAAAKAAPVEPSRTLSPTAFQHRTWLTRPRPGIDRIASAWLIRRFIDPEATFAFGEPESRAPGTVAFDTFEGDFTHAGDRCTFEMLCTRFDLSDARLPDIAELVHDLDLKDGKYRRQDAPLLGALVEGLRQTHRDDHALLDRGIELFESLYHGQVSRPADARTARRRGRTTPLRRSR